MTGYIGAAVPTRVIWASGVTLFDVAARELGDATQWYRIAALNDLTDPWITGSIELKIPSTGESNGGVLGL